MQNSNNPYGQPYPQNPAPNFPPNPQGFSYNPQDPSLQPPSQPSAFQPAQSSSSPHSDLVVPPSSAATPPLNPYATAPKDHSKLILGIILGLVSVIAIVFIALFIWKYVDWNKANTNLQGQIDEAVATAVDENTTELEAEFAAREKEPNKDFAGPSDYGSLSFRYPKTWSLYEAKDASNGGDYEAYLNPSSVPPIDDETPIALRVTITDDSYDKTLATYNKYVEKGTMSLTMRQSESGKSIALFTGTLPSKLNGAVAILKIRDKTALIQTDSLSAFSTDYETVLNSINFSE